jgi:hypothetical protein
VIGIELEAMHEFIWQVLAEEDGDYGEWEEDAGTERLLQASQVYDEKESMDVYLSIILQAQEILLSAEGTSENTREKLSTELASLAKEVGARREILDSGCSISMSGIDGRLTDIQERRSTAREAR